MLAQPEVEVLLDVDREYRDKARAGLLPKIAPRRLHPDQTLVLPVLHTRFGPWEFTALFSNTELAYEMHRTRDWVVIFFSDPEGEEGQFTVVTERRGELTGRRVVRGREPECARCYRSATTLPDRQPPSSVPR